MAKSHTIRTKGGKTVKVTHRKSRATFLSSISKFLGKPLVGSK